jgi:hypothetical protein
MVKGFSNGWKTMSAGTTASERPVDARIRWKVSRRLSEVRAPARPVAAEGLAGGDTAIGPVRISTGRRAR